MPKVELWSRLSLDLVYPKSRLSCQACGVADCILDRWQEHDNKDQPEPIVVVLCGPCSRRLIDSHPRLYRRLDKNEPLPGSLALCDDCRYRCGVRCTSPLLKANGGPGLLVTIKPPSDVHLCRSPRRLSGWIKRYPSPASACAGRELREVN